MAVKTVFSPRAAIDLESILDHYQELDKKLVVRYYQGFKKILNMISKNPLSGRLIPELHPYHNTRYREIIFEVFRLVYKIEKQRIIIVRILDQRQLFRL